MKRNKRDDNHSYSDDGDHSRIDTPLVEEEVVVVAEVMEEMVSVGT